MKKVIKIIGIFILIVCVGVWISTSSRIFPIALNENMDTDYKFKDYKIKKEKVKKAIIPKGIKRLDYKDVDWTESIYPNFYTTGRTHGCYKKSNFSCEINLYDPYLAFEDSNIVYNRKDIEKSNLAKFYFYNKMQVAYQQYGLLNMDNYETPCNYYYKKNSFVDKTKIKKEKNNTFIIYPTEVFYGLRADPDCGIPNSKFPYKYGQNILVLQDDVIMQVRIFNDKTNEKLLSVAVDITNEALKRFNDTKTLKTYSDDPLNLGQIAKIVEKKYSE